MDKNMNRISKYAPLIALLIGALSFILVAGVAIVNPKNIVWLTIGDDPAQHYLGWEFFRNSVWTWPVGLNPNYGLGFSSSIVFSDSIPLLAILLKPISAFLGEPFQYLGLWALMGFMLQAFFAYLIIQLFSKNKLICLLGAALVVFSPVIIWRINEHAVNSHFLLLAALYFVFRPTHQRRLMWWAVLLSATLLVHFYLFAMVLALWLSDLLDRCLIQKEISYKKVIYELLIVNLLLFVLFWQAGYLAISAGSAVAEELYGYWSLDPLALFGSRSWSYLLPDIVSANHSIDNFIFFGLGMIAIIILVLVKFTLAPRKNALPPFKKHLFLLLCFTGLTIFALSHNIHIGRLRFSYDLPETLLHLASTFRWSGKLFWPVYYGLIFGFLYLLIKLYSEKMVIIIMSLALFIQIIDTSAGWLPRRHILNQQVGSQYDSPLLDPFWEIAAKKYKLVQLMPLEYGPRQSHWSTFAPYAAIHHMGTDSVYIARPDAGKIQRNNSKLERALFESRLDPNTLYILDNRVVTSVVANINMNRDLLARIDNVNVLAPNWIADANEVNPLQVQAIGSLLFQPGLNQKIEFSENGNGKFLTGWGWAPPENWGAWADASTSSLTLMLPIAMKKNAYLEINARALVSNTYPSQRVNIKVDGHKVGEFSLSKADGNLISLPITRSEKPFVTVEFENLDRVRPKDLGMGADRRLLSIGIVSATFKNAPVLQAH
jgi:hypothetical protein